jgi:hypothetical protein
MVVGLCFCLLFLFVPETFWDRTPQPKKHHSHHESKKRSRSRLPHLSRNNSHQPTSGDAALEPRNGDGFTLGPLTPNSLVERRKNRGMHVGFATQQTNRETMSAVEPANPPLEHDSTKEHLSAGASLPARHDDAWKVEPMGGAPITPHLHNLNSPYYEQKSAGTTQATDYFNFPTVDKEASQAEDEKNNTSNANGVATRPKAPQLIIPDPSPPKSPAESANYFGSVSPRPPSSVDVERGESQGPVTSVYTDRYRSAPPKSYKHSLRPFNGRLCHDNWFHVMLRPFILFAYPSVLWSAVVYSLSIGWLIVLSESVSTIYKNRETYNFTSLQAGLVYISPFIGGVLGTAVAGKVSDILVRYMARRNDGIYEPEFRLVMAIPIAISTTIGLMGFGWSAEERDSWIVPTIFFGCISFGCSLGSTTSITFCVDSYRQYAGEALVTLNFSKSEYRLAY